MPPLAAPRTDDGPMCRVCGCTRHNACPVGYEIIKEGDNAREVGVGCEWVETSGRDVPRWLCSACSGTAADLAEVLDRIAQLSKSADHHLGRAMALAARIRYQARIKLEKGEKP